MKVKCKQIFIGLIKPGKYGAVTEGGIKYFYIYSWFTRWFILRPVKFIQKTLWFCGVAVHDPIFGECTPDFNCCVKIGRKAFIRIKDFQTERKIK